MTKIILINILFLFFCSSIFAQTKYKAEYNNITRDSTSYLYYTNLHHIIEKNSKLENTEIDLTSFYYYNKAIDSLTDNIVWGKAKVTISKFGGLQPDTVKIKTEIKEKIVKKKKSIFPQWLIAIFLISLIIIAWTNYYYSKYLRQLFKAFINLRASLKLYEASNILIGRSSTALTFNFFIIMSLTLFLFIEYFIKIKITPNFMFLALFLMIIIIYFIKNFFIFLLGKIVNISKTAAIYNYNIGIYNQVLGIIIAPLLLFVTYFNVKYILIFFGIILITLLLIYIARVVRTIKIFLYEHFSLLYLFLYLCIVEILPLFILLKFYYLYKI